MKLRGTCVSRRLALIALAAAVSLPCQAANILWSSHDTALDPSNNQNWSNGANWVGGIAPVDGDSVEIGIPVAGGNRITINDLPAGTQVNGMLIKANLNEVNGNSINLGGNVSYTAGGTSIGKIGAPVVLLQDTTYSVSATTSNGRLEVNGGISGSFALTKADAGRLRLAGTAKTYSGDTTVTGGILDLAADNMLPFGAGKGSIYVGTGAQLFLNNVNTQINGLNDYAGAPGSVSKTGSNTRSLTLGNGDANGDFSGAMTFTGGSSTVNKVGAGTQTLSGAVAVAGSGTVSGGRLNVNGTWTGGLIANAGGTLGGTGAITGNVSVNGNGTLAPGVSPGTLTINGGLTMAAGGVLQFDINGTDTTVGGGVNDLVTGVGNLTLDGQLNIAGSFFGAANGSIWRLINYSGTLVDNTLVLGSVPSLPSNGELTIDTSTPGQVNLVYTVPEPATCLLMVLGTIIGLLAVRRN